MVTGKTWEETRQAVSWHGTLKPSSPGPSGLLTFWGDLSLLFQMHSEVHQAAPGVHQLPATS